MKKTILGIFIGLAVMLFHSCAKDSMRINGSWKVLSMSLDPNTPGNSLPYPYPHNLTFQGTGKGKIVYVDDLGNPSNNKFTWYVTANDKYLAINDAPGVSGTYVIKTATQSQLELERDTDDQFSFILVR